MKKFLSLVMALAMTLTLVTVGASAKDFTDKSSITYGEAVNVISGIGVVDGYTDGSFNPTATLTRGAAAKIICNMLLGPTTASALGVTSAPFKDVPVSNVFAGYIAYCSAQGIINGYTDGSFKPAATVTGYQFMKMLLGALGYDGAIEGFTGTNWTVNVAKLAVSIGLDDGNASFVGSKAMTREEAALYAFNTLNATMVKYSSKGTTITINGATIATGASSAEPAYAANSTSIKAGTQNASNEYTVEFAEKYFPDLLLATKYQDGIQGRTYSYKGQTISSYAATGKILATSMDGSAVADLMNETKSDYIGYKIDTTAKLFINGVEQTHGSPSTTDFTVADINTALSTTYDLRGVVFKFQDTNSDGKYNIVSVTKDAVAKVAAAPSVTTSGSVTSVTVSGIAGLSGVNVKYVFGYDGLAKGDYVMWHTDGTNYFITKCTSIGGTMTATTGSTGVTVDGTSYKVSEITNAQTQAQVKTEAWGKSGSTFYVDQGGYIVKAVASSSTVDLTNTLYAVEASAAVGYSNQTKVLFADGTQSVVTVGKVDSNTTTTSSDSVSHGAAANTFYTYTKETDGTYTLKTVTSTTQNTVSYTASTGSDTSKYAITKASTNFLKNVDLTASANVLATSSTAFVVEKDAGNGYNVYTGIANVPNVKATASSTMVSYLCDSDGYAIFVVALNGTSVNTSATLDYVFAYGSATETYVSSSESYFTFPAVVNGEITTINATASDKLTAGTLLAVTSYDSGKVAAASATGLVIDMNGAAAGVALAGVDDITINGTSIKFSNNGAMVNSGVVTDATEYFIYDTTKSPATMTASTADEIDALSGGSYTIQAVQKSETDSTIAQLFVTKAANTDTAASFSVSYVSGSSTVPVLGTLSTSTWTNSPALTGSVVAGKNITIVASVDPNAVVTYSTDGTNYVASLGTETVAMDDTTPVDTTVYFKVTTNGSTATYTVVIDIA